MFEIDFKLVSFFHRRVGLCCFKLYISPSHLAVVLSLTYFKFSVCILVNVLTIYLSFSVIKTCLC